MERHVSLREKLIKRFRYLWTWELLNALVVFPFFLFAISQNIQIGISAILATMVTCIILIIGSAFSFLKYQDLRHGTHNIGKYENIFRLLRWIIPIAIGLILIVNLQLSFLEAEDWFIATLFYLMAILEYINYFHFQLMYDNKNDLGYLSKYLRLKQGLIAREFGW